MSVSRRDAVSSVELRPKQLNPRASVFAFNGQVPGPLIHIREGDDVTVHVTTNTTLPHTIHWHGVDQLGTWKSDGVPDITQKSITLSDDEIRTLVVHLRKLCKCSCGAPAQ